MNTASDQSNEVPAPAWPKHADGSNKTMGEMTREERRAQWEASCRRFAAQTGFRFEPKIVAALTEKVRE